jgi:excisionase family DNA binding protein
MRTTELPPPAGPAAPSVQSARLLTVMESARLLGLGKTTIYQLMESGRLPYFRFGSARRIDPADLEALKTECRVGPARHNECGIDE